MITFIYSVKDGSVARGYNQTVTVWRLKQNKPVYIGYNDKINTAYTKGEKGEAISIITENTNHKSVKNGYDMDSTKYALYQV